MNERIEQLAEQCWVHTNEPLFAAKSPHWEFDRKKFAELLIRECMDICEQQRLKILNNQNDPSWTEHLAECQTTMEQTFLRS